MTPTVPNSLPSQPREQRALVCEGGQVVKGAAGRVPESRPGWVAIDIAGWAYQCLPAVDLDKLSGPGLTVRLSEGDHHEHAEDLSRGR
jgi:hypothetical protein